MLGNQSALVSASPDSNSVDLSKGVDIADDKDVVPVESFGSKVNDILEDAVFDGRTQLLDFGQDLLLNNKSDDVEFNKGILDVHKSNGPDVDDSGVHAGGKSCKKPVKYAENCSGQDFEVYLVDNLDPGTSTIKADDETHSIPEIHNINNQCF